MTLDAKIKKELGLVQVYTGNGKGKTTASLGLALRAMGTGLSVGMIQFMKHELEGGEYEMSKVLDNFTLISRGPKYLLDPNNLTEEDGKVAYEALETAKEMIYSEKYDLFIMDEINTATGWKLIDVKDVIEMLKNRPKNIEIVLTGRYAPDEIIEYADLVTEMRKIKHPFDKGVDARKGIEG
ncbi:MAG: cob(I)yrinic acid a,c-diamide adenosyltransferase [Methanomassiliicoccaceae archaeon]|nr:cob(I)yrinic acid a,c-diamide adenosyltransferase [Methanomassiliicoccaceae archaeon]